MTNEPASPIYEDGKCLSTGLTIRDRFAMTAMLATLYGEHPISMDGQEKKCVDQWYKFADAMVARRLL